MKKNQLAVPADLEARELRALARRTDARLDRMAREELAAALEEERQKRTAEWEAHNREMQGFAAAVSIFALLGVAITCILAAPWWTAVSPAVGIALIFRKVGW